MISQMFHIALLVLATLSGGAPQAQRDRVVVPDAVGTAVISGRVTILDVNGTPQPVRRARVTLEADALTTPQKADTDTQGRYRFEKLPAGVYRIRAQKAGFVPQLRDLRRAFEKPAGFDVAEGQKLAIDLPMARGAALEGRILKDTGDPAVNVVVAAMRFSYDANGRRATPVRQALTDDRGHFRIHSLPAGEYYLEAANDPLEVARLATPVQGRPLTMLARAFYPGAPRIEGSRSISLATGQEIANLDFSVPTVPAVAIRLSVLDSTGAPGKNPGVRLQRVGGPTGEVRGFMGPGPHEASFPVVPSGEFWMMGSTQASPTAEPEFAVTRMSLIGDAVPPIVLTTARGAVVNGRVEVEGGAPLPESLRVVAHETDFELPASPNAPPGAVPGAIAADGAFAFSSLFGPRLLRVQPLPQGWALKSVVLDGVDITDTPVDFRGGETPRTARVIVTTRTSAVTGMVRDETGRPAVHVRVVVFSADDRTWGWRSRTVKSGESDEAGRYTIEGLLDGKYLIVAVPFLEDGSWLDTTILGRLQALASPVGIGASTKVTTDLVVKK